MTAELLACFQVLHERHVTLESQFGGIAQRWAASHQDIIPAKLRREAIRNREKKNAEDWECFSTTPAEARALSGAYGRSTVGQRIVWILREGKHWEKAWVVPLGMVICIHKTLGIICKEGGRIWNGPCKTHRQHDAIIRHQETELEAKLKGPVREGLAAPSGNKGYCEQK